MFDVVGVGNPCVDENVSVNELPKPNHGSRMNQRTWQGGGLVPSGLVASSRLGAKCAIIGAVGDDLFGRFSLRDFKLHGIDTSNVYVREGQCTPMNLVLSDKETMGRSIMGDPGGMGRLTPVSMEEVNLDLIKESKYFFISSMVVRDPMMIELVKIAREAGTKVFIDASNMSEEMYNFIPNIDIFVASEFFYDDLFDNDNYEENCKKIMDMGPEIVVFTFGEKGCVGISKDGFFQLPAFKVDVVDTVGAGDVYHGAFVAGLLSGRSAMETARFASAVSAIKCTRIGGRAGIPDTKTVERFMEDGFIDYTEIDQRVSFYSRGLEGV